MAKDKKSRLVRTKDSFWPLVHIDRNIMLGFSTLILIVMLVVLGFGIYYSQDISKKDESKLEEVITGILADSIDRVSFSGKYHARLLVEQITQSQPRIMYVMIVGLNGRIMAHSDPSMNNKALDVDQIAMIPEVVNGEKTIISEETFEGKTVSRIVMPYHSGYLNKINGIIIVGLSIEELREKQREMWHYIGAMIVSMLLVSLGTTYILGKVFAGPVKNMALQLKGILEHAPLLISISDRESNENITSVSFNDLTERAPELLDPELRYVFENNMSISHEVTRNIGDDVYTFLINSFPIITDDKGKTTMACSIAMDVTDRKAAEDSLRESRANLQITLDSIGDAVIATDARGRINMMNPLAQELTEWTFEQAKDMSLGEVFRTINTETNEPVLWPSSFSNKISGKKTILSNLALLSKKGTQRRIAVTYAPILDEGNLLVGFVFVFRDITQEYELQQQLRQSQKMEAIGQLAGGVAHDFNNLLTAITGNAELIEMNQPEETPDLKYARGIIKAADRASELVKQLLAFSRKAHMQIVEANMHDIISDVIELLSRSIEKNISIVQQLNAECDKVEGDPSMLQNAILNLGLNARDAMPNGGILTFSTRSVYMDAQACENLAYGIAPGRYIEIAVTDTGVGMDEDIQKHIFEPFFTTKQTGKGTGLGLAGVYGCMESHKGIVSVYSKPDQGSSFKLMLPTVCSCLESISDIGLLEEDKLIYGQGNVLVVDDENVVLDFATNTLTELGYDVESCGNGREAVEYVKANADKIGLVILDMSMPDLSGEETFTAINEIAPDIPIILSSGYSRSKDADSLIARGAAGFIGKPFGMRALSQSVAYYIREL